MSELIIDRIRVYAVGPKTPRFSWAEGMAEQFMTNTLVRVTTRDGLEGIGAAASYSETGFDRAVAETMRHQLPLLLGESAHRREAIWQRLHDLNLPQALPAARLLEELGFAWFEAPLVDTDLEGYRELRTRVDVPILPAGNWILDLRSIAQAIAQGCWSSVRVDATIAGGITPTLKVMALAEANAMTTELQCWGYTLTQAANLHLMLARGNCTYFEQPVPYPAFEAGFLDVIRTDGKGYVHAPPGDGLGIRVDWEATEAASFLRYEICGDAQNIDLTAKEE